MALDLSLTLPPKTAQEAAGKTVGEVGIATGEALDKLKIAVGDTYQQEFNLASYIDLSSGNDDAAFAQCIQDAREEKGSVTFKGRIDRMLRLTQPQIIQPFDTDSEIRMPITSHIPIEWVGGSNQTVFTFLGLRACTITDLQIAIRGNATDVTCIDLRTGTGVNGGPGRNSTTGLNFNGGGNYLGSGQGNIGVRMGFESPGPADISQIFFDNYNTNSAADNGAGQHTGAQNCIARQYGFRNQGHNTLNVGFKGCILAYLNSGYDNTNGNGAVTFENMVTSHCRMEYRIGGVQNYTWTGCRSEDSINAIHVTDSNDTPIMKFDHCLWDNLIGENGRGFYFQRPALVSFIGGAIQNAYESYDSRLMRFDNFDGAPERSPFRKGLFQAQGTAVQGNAGTPFYSIEGDSETPSAPRFRVDVKNCPILNAQNLVTGFYTDRNTI